MKKYIAVLILSFIGATSSLAQNESDTSDGPCMKMLEACKAAGFGSNDSAKPITSLSKDCLRPLLAGQKVQNVQIDAASIEACKEKKEKLKQSK
jgi:hypothetical protein